MTNDVIQAKQAARLMARERMSGVSIASCIDRSRKLCDQLEQSVAFSRASMVVAFWPVVPTAEAAGPTIPQSWAEPDIRPVLQRALARGVRVGLPRIDWDQRAMDAAEIRDPQTDLTPGRHGIWTPSHACPKLDLSAADVILVPGMAFGPDGRRLGRGGGFYDRFLSLPWVAQAVTIGICFEAQVLADIPVAPHDIAVSRIITESREILAHG